MEDYIIVVKPKSEFQKFLNQWKHQFNFEIIWMVFDKTNEFWSEGVYRALIKRCPK